jgi:chromosomal replication initiator protein
LILLRLKLYDTTSRIITESELLAEVIIKMVGQYYLLSENYYLDKTRITEYVMARYIAMKLIKLNTKSSLAKIGKMFKGKDHATVLHGINLISDLCETDKIFKMDYENLANKLELKY